MEDVIRVSFKKSEKQLYSDIINECNIIGQSAWIKLAAVEKLQRDKSIIPMTQSTNIINVIDTSLKQNNKLPIIGELTELFKS